VALMPRVTLRDPFGMTFQISTMNDDLLQRWFDEWLPRLFPANMPQELGDPLVEVWPLTHADGRSLDWAAKSQHMGPFTIPRNPAKALAVIEERRQWIEAQP
jgi:hypothetical protein